MSLGQTRSAGVSGLGHQRQPYKNISFHKHICSSSQTSLFSIDTPEQILHSHDFDASLWSMDVCEFRKALKSMQWIPLTITKDGFVIYFRVLLTFRWILAHGRALLARMLDVNLDDDWMSRGFHERQTSEQREENFHLAVKMFLVPCSPSSGDRNY